MPLGKFYYGNCVGSIVYKYRASSDDVQRRRIVTPLTFFMELTPFENFIIEIVPAQELWHPLRYFYETWYEYEASPGNMQRLRTRTQPIFFKDLAPL